MTDRKGLWYAFLAYAGWGLLPAYWNIFERMSPYELLSYRMVFSALTIWAWVAMARRTQSVASVMRDGRRARWMALGSLMITINWLTFIVAVNTGHVVESSLGYYINPIVNVIFGLLLFRERLDAWQWGALLVAGLGVAIMIAAYGQVPWLALSLSGSFGLYGVVKKRVEADAVQSLTWETTLALPLAVAYLVFTFTAHRVTVTQLAGWQMAMLALSGVLTALPLLLFAMAAKRLHLATLGMVQYISPTLQLVIGLFVDREPFTRADAIGFSCIWMALILYTFSLIRTERRFRRCLADDPALHKALKG
ncbi:EamA family transporter RarD [Alicyclobacillus vulcanalis]|uniref:Chloramphenicol-sensitive protein RarD n=1 Tax=Alicyclobacillus vulcanalis TaxID=252246 RepID=A0A1N7N9C9_9BACL|nr:EamA family transporter RarD [Alicyclobacillus vulcanalis]SIS94809.1 chloramphenicol-sensitive protein RarD [Alicyclobacillus vulcanalis]